MDAEINQTINTFSASIGFFPSSLVLQLDPCWVQNSNTATQAAIGMETRHSHGNTQEGIFVLFVSCSGSDPAACAAFHSVCRGAPSAHLNSASSAILRTCTAACRNGIVAACRLGVRSHAMP